MRALLAAAAVLGATLVLYGSALRYPLQFDDPQINTYFAQPAPFGSLRWLSEASFAGIHRAFGAGLVWQRLANLQLHMTTALVLFGFLARLFSAVLNDERSRWLAFFGALWFLVHPAAVYGVAYLLQRSIVLATLFSIFALWCVLEGLLRRSAAWFAGAAVAYLLALWSKEAAILLPAVAGALAVLVGRTSKRTAAAALAVCAAIAASVIVQRRALLGAAYEPFAAEILGGTELVWPLSILNQATLFFRYLATWLVPWAGWMSVDLRPPFPRELLGWHALGFVAWLAYPVLALRLLRRGGRAGLAGFGLLAPWLLSLTELVTVRVQEPFVLYRSYLWMCCLPAILPAVVAPLAPRRQIALLAALCVALAIGAHGRIETFSSAVALWDDAVRKSDPAASFVERSLVSRGLAQLDAGRFAPAAADFARALEINPRFADAYLARGTLRLRTRRPTEALEDLDLALIHRPGYAAAYSQRCFARLQLQRAADALADCERALALNPLDDAAWSNTGMAQRSLGRSADAAASYRRALELKPGNGAAHYNYAALLLAEGRRDGEVVRHLLAACQGGISDACGFLDRLQWQAK